MIHLGLIGYPLGHSLSPKLHTAALQAAGLQGAYSLFPVHPDDRQSLAVLFQRVRAGEVLGLNVTTPHKQNVFEFLDELTPTAKSIGAVNTVYLRENGLIGDNTDAAGFLCDLRRFMDHEKSKSVNPKSSLILGAGGSARAVVYALVNSGWEVTIVARRVEQANELAGQFENTKTAEELSLEMVQHANVQLIVNTTPVGMSPHTNASPWPEEFPFPGNAAVYDLVYQPRETLLVSRAHAAGLCAATGLGMLVEQAALAFQLWTGHRPSREIMFEALVE